MKPLPFAAILLAAVIAATVAGQDVLPVVAPTESVDLPMPAGGYTETFTLEDENAEPIRVGVLAEFPIKGLSAVENIHVTILPRTAEYNLVLKGSVDPQIETWRIFGTDPVLQVTPRSVGRYTIMVFDKEAGTHHEKVFEVSGAPGPVEDLVVVPSTPFEPNGPKGGPFENNMVRYEITAANPTPIKVVPPEDVPWLIVSATGDTTPASVELIVNAAAESLDEGEYPAEVAVLNEQSGIESLISVALTVGRVTPPIESLQAVVVEQTEDRKPEHRAVILSTAIADRLGGKYYTVDPDTQGEWADRLQTWVRAAEGEVLPHLFFANQDGETVWHGPLPTSEAKVLDLIDNLFPGQPDAGDAGMATPAVPMRKVCLPGQPCFYVPMYQQAP